MSYSSDRVSRIKDRLKDLLPTYFGSTLDRETDVVNIVAALIHLESRFNVNAVGKINPVTNKNSAAYKYISSSCIQDVLTTGNPTQVANVSQGLQAIGLMQVVGWNFVRGASQTGKCEIERLRPDLVGQLVLAPGSDLITPYIGEANMDKALLAGLVILEGKYKAAQSNREGFFFKADPYSRVFSSRIVAAVAAYLGLGRADINNTTPEQYAQSIVGGSSYQLANGTSKIKISDSEVKKISSNGPSTNGSNQNKIGEPGCTPRRQPYATS